MQTGKMIDFRRAVQEAGELVNPSEYELERAKYNRGLAEQASKQRAFNEWIEEQRNKSYRPNAPTSPLPAPAPYNEPGFDRSSGILATDVPPTNEQLFLAGYSHDFGKATPGLEEKESVTKDAPETEQKSSGNSMLDAIQQELKQYDDGTYQYALNVLRRLPSVFAKYENADPSRAMPYFLAGQPGRQRETEMVRFNEFMR